jgi:hypothetical protein
MVIVWQFWVDGLSAVDPLNNVFQNIKLIIVLLVRCFSGNSTVSTLMKVINPLGSIAP